MGGWLLLYRYGFHRRPGFIVLGPSLMNRVVVGCSILLRCLEGIGIDPVQFVLIGAQILSSGTDLCIGIVLDPVSQFFLFCCA